jgi:hypothetical protein
MKIDEIYRLKRLAGIINKDGTPVVDPAVDSDNESNISIVGSEKAEYQRKNKIRPGTDEWFRLWFAKPYLTGEKPMKDSKE